MCGFDSVHFRFDFLQDILFLLLLLLDLFLHESTNELGSSGGQLSLGVRLRPDVEKVVTREDFTLEEEEGKSDSVPH